MRTIKSIQKKEAAAPAEAEISGSVRHLVLYNDDVNSFDHVINALVKICGHTEEQAGQCALIVHLKGKCEVRKGPGKLLSPMCEALCERGLTAAVEA